MAEFAPAEIATPEVRHRPRTGYLSTPLSQDEQRRVAQLYREHQGLIRLLGRKLCRKYMFLASDDIFSCIDSAFIKVCRAWNPEKGRFSTLLTVFAEGEVLHFVRDSNWTVKAPGAVRRVGQLARRMAERGCSRVEIMAQLGLSEDKLKLALIATEPTGHDTRDWEWHVCPRATPWEVLEAEEAA